MKSDLPLKSGQDGVHGVLAVKAAETRLAFSKDPAIALAKLVMVLIVN